MAMRPRRARGDAVRLIEVAQRAGIDLRCVRVPYNPDSPDSLSPHDAAWSSRASHWHCELVRRAATLGRPRRHVRYISLERSEEPQIDEVLRLLLLDAKAVGGPFEAWARTYGFNPDSRTAEQLFEKLRRKSDELKRFLGTFYEKAAESV